MVTIPKVSDRSANKPIYLVVAEDPTEKDGFAYYLCKSIMESTSFLDLTGFQLNKTQAGQLRKDPYAIPGVKPELQVVNRKIPWHKIIRIENTNYKKPQGENYE
jgi:hypothetical protein